MNTKINPESELIPLERRVVEHTTDNGMKRKVPALNKIFAPRFNYMNFYLIRIEATVEDPSLLNDWEDHMQIYRDDLKWLLGLPHYKFWSTMVYSEAISNQVLTSYLIKAPRSHEPNYDDYFTHSRIGPLLTQIHDFIFRIFLRLSTFKESKEDYFSSEKWGSLIYDHYLFDIPKLLDLVALYGTSRKDILVKMIENILCHQPNYVHDFNTTLPIYVGKWILQSEELCSLIRKQKKLNVRNGQWDFVGFEDIILFNVDQVISLYKLMELHPPFAIAGHKTSEFEFTIANTYEQDVQEWKQVLQHCPELENLVNVWRVFMLKLFRLVLAPSTIQTVDRPQNGAVDEFLGVISNCLESCVFLHDYDRTFPFVADIDQLRHRGVYVDSTRVEYLTNAFAAAFEACGQRYEPTKIEKSNDPVPDPLNDPTFDRQLLGACSLDVVGPELISLVSQVKDLLPDLPDAYIEACLKHFGYQTETVINAILEGSVPTSLEKFKEMRLEPVKLDKGGVSVEDAREMDFLYRRRDAIQDLLPAPDVKQRVLECYEAQEMRKWTNPDEDTPNDYLHKSLLPTFREDIEYQDEYDDTYDEAGMGMTEPDAMPLNPKLAPRFKDEEESDTEGESNGRNGGFEAFVEDPAIVRARMEQRRAEKYNRGHGQRSQGQGQRDVVGVGKGHGQSTEVVLNRRRKDEAGSHNRRKRADFKRREF